MSRFISLIIIVALGAGFFVGVKATSPSMTRTAERYFADNNFMDLFIRCSYGLTDDDISAIKKIGEVAGAQGERFADGLLLVNDAPETDLDGSQLTVRAYGVNLGKLQNYYYGADDSDYINRVTLLEGRFPNQSNQCLVDASGLSTPDSFKIGNVITIAEDAGMDLSGLVQKQFRNTAKRVDKGVHQAGFLVLRATSMPSVLIELGYINNANEASYLTSTAGVNTLAKSIYNAFVAYKR